jgi:hypothetical protein
MLSYVQQPPAVIILAVCGLVFHTAFAQEPDLPTFGDVVPILGAVCSQYWQDVYAN